MKVAFYKHNIGESEIASVVSVLNSTMHTAGPMTQKFERDFSAYLGCKSTVGVTSWTMGAFLCLRALGIGPGDEVIIPPLTFISTANIVCHVGATPVFVDVERETGLMDVEKVKQAITPRTRVIIPVHIYGAMCDMKALREIADKYNLAIIEDAAHCIEGTRDGVRPGQLSKAACFSFYATKNLACGDGGAVVSSDEKLSASVAKLRFHGMSRGSEERYSGRYRHYDMDELGYKCNLTDIQAAMLVPQLTKLEEYLQKKDRIAKCYEEEFREINGVDLIVTPPHTKHARHLFTFLAPDGKRDKCLIRLQEKGIGVAVHFNAVHLMSYYRRRFGFKKGILPNAEQICRRTVTLPLYVKMTNDEVSYVIQSVREITRTI